MKEAVLEALEERDSESLCCSSKCKELCGITQSEHFEQHKRMAGFFASIEDMHRSVRGIILKTVIMVLIGATIIGLGFKVEKLLKFF